MNMLKRGAYISSGRGYLRDASMSRYLDIKGGGACSLLDGKVMFRKVR
jgi:hypothetical protein